MRTDGDYLAMVLANVIANAVSYSAEGSDITIAASEGDGSVNLSVTNLAVDLTEQDLEVMLERLWRKDQSRTGSGHAGLGLALVKELAQLLNVKISSLLDERSRFTLSLSGLVRV